MSKNCLFLKLLAFSSWWRLSKYYWHIISLSLGSQQFYSIHSPHLIIHFIGLILRVSISILLIFKMNIIWSIYQFILIYCVLLYWKSCCIDYCFLFSLFFIFVINQTFLLHLQTLLRKLREIDGNSGCIIFDELIVDITAKDWLLNHGVMWIVNLVNDINIHAYEIEFVVVVMLTDRNEIGE